MLQERQGGGAPHGVILAVVVFIVVLASFLTGEAITEAISELLTPLGLLLLPLLLLLAIQFLSSDRLSVVSTGQPDTIHSLSGSPVGVGLFLLLVLFLLYHRVSIFGGGDDSDD